MSPDRSELYDNVMVLDRGEYTSCTVNLQGATVTSWRIRNREQLFVSRYTRFVDQSRIVGGIRFIFPVLGPWQFGPNDGFAKLSLWSVEEGPERLTSGDVCAVVGLRDNSYTRSLWNYKFKLSYKITLREKTLSFDIFVENPSEHYPLEFVIVQDCWLKVLDVDACEILGFKNCAYKDAVRDGKILRDDGDSVKIFEEINRIYLDAPNEMLLRNTKSGASLKIINKFISDIDLWNPRVKRPFSVQDIGSFSLMYRVSK